MIKRLVMLALLPALVAFMSSRDIWAEDAGGEAPAPAQESRISLHVIDMAGQRETPAFEVREASRSPADPPIFSGSTTDRWAKLSAGTYQLLTRSFPPFFKEVTVTDAGEIDVEFQAKNALWLRFQDTAEQPARPILVEMKSRERMGDALASIRSLEFYRAELGLLRPGIAKEETASALALARASIASRTKILEPATELSEQERDRVMSDYWRFVNDSTRVIAAAGVESDARLLMEKLPQDGWNAMNRASSTAYLESRLGLLETGQLAAALGAKDKDTVMAAAVFLHEYGCSQADDTLREFLADSSRADRVSFQLFADRDPRTLAAMRAAFQDSLKESNVAPGPALGCKLYLLVHGTEEDRRAVLARGFWSGDAFWLMFLAEDPRPLADLLASNPSDLARALPILRDLPDDREDNLPSYFEEAILAAAMAAPQSGESAQSPENLVNQFRAYGTFCRPSKFLAKVYYENNVSLSDAAWLPALWRKDEIYDNLVAGTLGWGWDQHLDYVPHAQLISELETRKAREQMPTLDIFLARHLVTTQGFYAPRDPVRDGIERRPFTVSSPANEGSISGVLELRPQFIGNTLRLTMRFKTVGYYHVSGFIDFNQGRKELWAHHPYLINGGQAFISKVMLRRGSATTPFADKGNSEDGLLVFETALDKADFTGMIVDVELSFLDQHHLLIFDLFASDAARTRRLLAARLPIARNAAKDNPNAAAWTRCAVICADLGLIEEAMDCDRQAFLLEPKDEGLRLAAADRFSALGDHQRAATILREAAEARPEDGSLQYNLAVELYRNRDHDAAAQAAAKSAALDPSDAGARLMHALCALLAGDASSAHAALKDLPRDAHSTRSLVLWRIATASTPGADPTAVEAAVKKALENPELDVTTRELLAASLAAPAPAPLDPARDFGDQCKLHAIAGYTEALIAKNPERAREHWSQALRSRQTDLPEFRLAEAGIASLHSKTEETR